MYLLMIALTAICFTVSAQQGKTKKARVKQGIKSGEVTKKEVVKIREVKTGMNPDSFPKVRQAIVRAKHNNRKRN